MLLPQFLVGKTPLSGSKTAICPGYRATDLAGPGVAASQGATDPAEGAGIVVQMALLGPDGPSGGFYDSNGMLRPW